MNPRKGDPATVIVLSGEIRPADIPGLCTRARSLLQAGGAGVVICDVGAVTVPDAAAVDAVARLQLTAKRLGREMKVRNACAEMQELIALTGLSHVLPMVPG